MAVPLSLSFASVASSDTAPEQEQELYQADEHRVSGLLQGCLCCCTPCYEEDNARYSSSFRSDLLRGRAYWTGDLAADYGFHVANEHPLLGCFMCHPAHPYNKLERFAVLMIVSCLAFTPTFAFLRWSKHTQGKQAKEPGVPGEVVAVEQLVTRLGAQIEILLLVTVPSLAIQLILESLAILDFQLQEGTGLGKLVVCKPFSECITRCIVAMKQGCLVYSFGLVGLIFYLTVTTIGRKSSVLEAVGPFLMSRAQSWTVWFVLDGFMPCCGFLARWCCEGKPLDSDCGSIPKGMSIEKRQIQLSELPVHERKKEVRKQLNTALEALAKKREEAALLQWRIHHLEVELIELETDGNGLATMNGLPDMGTLDSRYPQETLESSSSPSGWRRV